MYRVKHINSKTLPFGLSTAPLEFTFVSKEVKLMALPVPRRLVGLGQIPLNLSPAHTNTSSSVSGTRLASKFGKIRTGTKAGFRLCRLPVQSKTR